MHSHFHPYHVRNLKQYFPQIVILIWLGKLIFSQAGRGGHSTLLGSLEEHPAKLCTFIGDCLGLPSHLQYPRVDRKGFGGQ